MPTGISYLDETWNPTHGCSPASAGCANCWAKRMSKRLAAMGASGYSVDNPFKPTCHPDRLDIPLHWKKPRRIGVSFMGDLFHTDLMQYEATKFCLLENDLSLEYEYFLRRVFVTMLRADWHTYFVLTKRPGNMKDFIFNYIPPDIFINEPKRDHIRLGVSVENQQAADERIPILLRIPAAVHWVSVEPMLGPVDLRYIPVSGNRILNGLAGLTAAKPLCEPTLSLTDICEQKSKLALVVCGAESGPGARLMDMAWARDLRDQCKAAGVPFYMKQVSGGQPIPQDLQIREMP